ncbi:probable E3 ubiquitin-protein ligase RNF217 isoform X2 [Juglans microcarpa x Juglans regia]|uniref:probable E3 ubiquitin-protein ligase RNF217 isoform X2 n=1 Tax=Juglans microcarpa x Juglans regia TaxID=2249226 RepID=UPI001B7F4E3A|nr:probable E3 ubiquitin-protein ligase RNF217 isoform X2 [Juglans microcarpa x Juglans regia]
MAQESAVGDLMYVDDFFLSILFDVEEENEILPLSDEKYAEELQFQEVLMGSMITSQHANKGASSSSSFSSPLIQACSSTQNPEPVEETKEAGESSSCFCEICAERKDSEEMFKNHSCVHSFCSDCISKHVATKIQESITVVSCPELGCETVLTIDACRRVLPKEVQERWDSALCETQVLAFQTFYCPFKDCSAMLLNDNEGGEVIRQSECPSCHRLFCAQCYVAWHPGVECEEYQRLNEDERGRDDLMVRELARERRWMRCPSCKYYVEKTEGCLHITCRCAFQFCYGCGVKWTGDHGGCQRD